MAEALQQFQEGTALNQAFRFHSRERRRSLMGVPEMHRTSQVFNKVRTLAVTGATNATPIVITTAAHGYITGMTVTIVEVEGNTAANGTFVVTVLTDTTFELDGSVGDGVYTTGGSSTNDADMPVPLIDTDAIFPVRSRLITFLTAVRITDNAGSHRGLVFEFGDTLRGAALWIEDQRIGFHAGATGAVDGADAIFDNTEELPVGLELDLVVAVRPGDGRVRMWGNGTEIARGAASGGDFDGDWTATEDGSFASAPATGVVPDVPATSRIAPNAGFEVIDPLSVFVNQVPRHFV